QRTRYLLGAHQRAAPRKRQSGTRRIELAQPTRAKEQPEMKLPLRILHLEDSRVDAELVEASLADEGIACEVTLVETRDSFLAALENDRFDLILADYNLP